MYIRPFAPTQSPVAHIPSSVLISEASLASSNAQDTTPSHPTFVQMIDGLLKATGRYFGAGAH